MAMIGANPDELRALGERFEDRSGTAAEAAAMTGVSVHDVRWHGPDADRFRSDFETQIETRLSDLAVRLQA